MGTTPTIRIPKCLKSNSSLSTESKECGPWRRKQGIVAALLSVLKTILMLGNSTLAMCTPIEMERVLIFNRPEISQQCYSIHLFVSEKRTLCQFVDIKAQYAALKLVLITAY